MSIFQTVIVCWDFQVLQFLLATVTPFPDVQATPEMVHVKMSGYM